MRLPLIPLSPYIQTSCEYAKVLAQTTKSLSEEDNASIKASLEKSLNKEREKLDRLTKSMQTIQSSCLLDFNIYDIAKEIAYINCSLFRLVTLDKTWLCNFDKQSNIVPLLDFHRYLSHSFAHQVIYGDANNKSVMQLIHLAYILLHVYRDFSGCTAILTSLHMPEVRRLESMWGSCPVKLVQVYQELVAMLSPDNNYESYHHQLWLHTNRFLDTAPSKSHMVAVPFMHAHLAIIQNLVQTHASVQAVSDIVLSSAGQPLLTSTVQLLEFCQQFSKIDRMELEQYATVKNNKRASYQSTSKRSSKAIKLSTAPCLDLDLLRSDANVYHWIVSRAYLTRSQLHAESLYVEPLAVGEIELEPEEEHDMYWDFFYKDEFVVVEEPTPVKKVSTENDDAAKQQDSVVVQETVDALDVVDSCEPFIALNHIVKEEHVPIAQDNETSNPTQDGTLTVQDDVVVKDQPAVVAESSKSKAQVTPISSKTAVQQAVPVNKDEVESMPTTQVPEDTLILRTTTTAATDTIETDDDDDDIIILTEEDDEEWTGYPIDSTPSQTAEETDLEDEDEEWTGYPITSQDEEEDNAEEDEVWKGYPIPSSEDEQQQQQHVEQEEEQEDDDQDEARKSPIDIASPNTPSEENG
ncbi:hypothetical protein G6F42_017119 [Rhizopus arrhizus]|nr:hypothetical protein G6F42_017119 [Rhizopus arrhizus]